MKPITFILFLILFEYAIGKNITRNDNISYCCDINNNILGNGSCIDNSRLNLAECWNTFSFYLEDDHTLEIDKNGQLIIDGLEPRKPNRYCYVTEYETMRELFVVCFDESEVNVNATPQTINTSLEFISVVFIIITVIIYWMLPQMQDQQGVIMIHSISGLAFAFMFLGSLHFLRNLEDIACHFMAYGLYFSFLYAFFWLNILCFHIWRQVVNITIFKKVQCWRRIYYLYGIFGPCFCLLLVMMFNHSNFEYLEAIHPKIGQERCWFATSKQSLIYFYGPVAVLISSNIIYFLWTALVLWKEWNISPKTKVLNYRLKMYSRLFLIMGITWIFEVLSVVFEDDNSFAKYIWIISDAFNALEGVVIFLIMVVFRKKVIRALANRKCCGVYRFPARWRQEQDSECDPIEEEINLSTA